MPHYVTSDLDLHCLSMTLLRFPGKLLNFLLQKAPNIIERLPMISTICGVFDFNTSYFVLDKIT